ncbi:MAG: hypothetical protein IMW94_09295 [Thermoanaerobacter sp.]|nr:hypothetical protein [Thermoanaerobacter sp.]
MDAVSIAVAAIIIPVDSPLLPHPSVSWTGWRTVSPRTIVPSPMMGHEKHPVSSVYTNTADIFDRLGGIRVNVFATRTIDLIVCIIPHVVTTTPGMVYPIPSYILQASAPDRSGTMGQLGLHSLGNTFLT